jgi:hypothetical protein
MAMKSLMKITYFGVMYLLGRVVFKTLDSLDTLFDPHCTFLLRFTILFVLLALIAVFESKTRDDVEFGKMSDKAFFVSVYLAIVYIMHSTAVAPYEKYLALHAAEGQQGKSSEKHRLWSIEKTEERLVEKYVNIRKGELGMFILSGKFMDKEIPLVCTPLNGTNFGSRYYAFTYEILPDAKSLKQQYVICTAKNLPRNSAFWHLYPKLQVVHWELHVTEETMKEARRTGLIRTKKTIADALKPVQPEVAFQQ